MLSTTIENNAFCSLRAARLNEFSLQKLNFVMINAIQSVKPAYQMTLITVYLALILGNKILPFVIASLGTLAMNSRTIVKLISFIQRFR